MATAFGKRNWVAVESMDGDEGQDVTLLEVPSETIESELVEVTGLDKDIEALVDAGEDLEDDQAVIDDLTANAEASLEEEGMDETGATATAIAVESFCRKYDLPNRKVAKENFSGATRRESTIVAVEALKDTAANMWTAFVTWLKELIAKGKDQLLKLTNAGKAMKSRADKLEKRLDKGLGALDKKDISGSFLANLTVDEKVDYAECLKFSNGSASTADSMGKAVLTGIDQAGKILRAGKVEGANGTSAELITGNFGKKTQKKLTVPQGAEKYSVVALPGNGYLISYTVDGISQSRYEAIAGEQKEKKIATLSAADCKSGVTALFAVGETLETKLKAFRDANEKLNTLVTAVTDAAKALKEATAENRKDLNNGLKAARAAVNTAKASERAVTSSLKNAGTGIAGYIAASISAYKAV